MSRKSSRFSEALAEVFALSTDVDELIDLVSRLSKRARGEVEAEISAQLATRAVFLLLGEVEHVRNYDRVARKVGSSLDGYAVNGTDLVRKIAALRNSLDSAAAVRRSSLRDLPYPTRMALLRAQGERCGVCGRSFRGESGNEDRTRDTEPTLDHIHPYRLGGDGIENLWILCNKCNRIKRETLHVAETGKIWADNFVYWRNLSAVAFWSMYRDGRCRVKDCDLGPGQTEMQVERRKGSGSWTFDNCVTVCAKHSRFDTLPY